MIIEFDLYQLLYAPNFYLWLIYGLVNLFTLLAMYVDKQKAVDHERRIQESKLLFWAIAFGALGVFLGMWWFRHKIRTWYFYVGVPLALIENIIVFKALSSF